jgi:hypothetical protein
MSTIVRIAVVLIALFSLTGAVLAGDGDGGGHGSDSAASEGSSAGSHGGSPATSSGAGSSSSSVSGDSSSNGDAGSGSHGDNSAASGGSAGSGDRSSSQAPTGTADGNSQASASPQVAGSASSSGDAGKSGSSPESHSSGRVSVTGSQDQPAARIRVSDSPSVRLSGSGTPLPAVSPDNGGEISVRADRRDTPATPAPRKVKRGQDPADRTRALPRDAGVGGKTKAGSEGSPETDAKEREDAPEKSTSSTAGTLGERTTGSVTGIQEQDSGGNPVVYDRILPRAYEDLDSLPTAFSDGVGSRSDSQIGRAHV